MAHDKILTNWSRWRRRISSNPSCVRSLAEKEDALHAVHDCKESREVWLSFIPPILQVSFFSMDLREWILTNLTSRENAGCEMRWPESMALICWLVWRWRCRELFDDSKLSIVQKVEFVWSYIMEMESAFNLVSAQCEGRRNNVVLGKI